MVTFLIFTKSPDKKKEAKSAIAKRLISNKVFNFLKKKKINFSVSVLEVNLMSYPLEERENVEKKIKNYTK